MLRGILLWLALSLACCQGVYKKYQPNIDPEAQCLDGSPAILYAHQGAETQKYLLFFLGGGMCAEKAGTSATLESCYQRSMTQLGSSLKWPEEATLDGYLSTDPAKNPTFYNWTKVFFAYCDGMIHQGYRKVPVSYKGVKLYFKGNRITKQGLDWVDRKYGLFSQSTDVVLTGMSAGGAATFLWSNYLQSKIPHTKVQLIIDSGLFLNELNHITKNADIEQAIQVLAKTVNTEVGTPIEECDKVYPNEIWRCLYLQYVYKFINERSLLVNSMYDSWSISNILGAKCVNGNDLSSCDQAQMRAIQQHHQKFLEFGAEYLAKAGNSIWAIACCNHVYLFTDFYFSSPLEAVPMLSGNTCSKVIADWIAGQDVKVYDVVAWPNNTPCAHIRF